MDITQKLRVAFLKPASLAGHKTLESYLSASYDTYYRFLCIIAEAMSFEFEIATYSTESVLLDNGSWTGAIGMISRSEADMTTNLFLMTTQRMEVVHFPFPFKLQSTTFIVKKLEYTPQISGLFKVFSLSTWLTLIVTLLVIVLLKFKLMKPKYTLQDSFFHVISMVLGQSPIMKPHTSSQYVAICSWMFGAMFLSFCYTSVLLSFLTFPPTFKIKDMEDLAAAIQSDGYQCMVDSSLTIMPSLFAKAKSLPLATIGECMYDNPNRFGEFEDFFGLRNEKTAFFVNIEKTPNLPDSCFMSNDEVMRNAASMAARKDFCCKKQLDTVIHRIMASGIYLKVVNDRRMLAGLKFSSVSTRSERERKLTLTEFSLAFIILVFGLSVSLVVLTVEKFLHSKTAKM